MNQAEASKLVHPFFDGAPERITVVAYHEIPHIKRVKGTRLRELR